MKTQKEQIQNFLKGILFGMFVVAVMFATVGCSKDDKSSNNDRRNNWWRDSYRYGGSGPGGYGQVGFIGVGIETQNRAQMILEVSQGNYDPNVGYGSGQSFIAGELDVNQPIVCMGGMMALDAGYYRIESNGYSNMYGELIQSATVVAYGNRGEAVLQLSNMYFFRGTMGQYDGLVGMVYVASVNGYPCGASIQVTDQPVGYY